MTPITPDGFLPICDMVNMPYFEHIPFVAKTSGIVMVHSKMTGNVIKTLSSLDNTGKYIAIVREADDDFDGSLIEQFPHVKYWFVTNCIINHPRVEAIPFGLSFGSTNRTQSSIDRISALLKTPKNISQKVFGCCSINPNCGDIVERRAPARDAIKDKPWGEWSEPLGADKYLEAIYNHEFMISPAGGGIDCVRTWETLYLHSIPIVKRCTTYEHFNDMPIAFLDDWNEINPGWCEKQKAALENKSRERLYIEYWIDRVNEMKRRYL